MNNTNRIEERQNGKALGVIAFPQGGNGYVPSIRVAGKWLNKFGFDIGDTVILTASQGKILIRKGRGTNDPKDKHSFQISPGKVSFHQGSQ